MATTSPTKPNLANRNLLEGQIRDCYGRVVYSHKTHEKCADILHARLSWIKLSQIGLSAIATAGFVSTVFGTNSFGAIVGGLVSAALLVLNAYTKNYDLGELAQKHKQAAAEVWLIREKYLSLITDLRIGHKSMDILVSERDKLLQELHAVYLGSPATNDSAYKKAQKALQHNEDLTFTDSEIDEFLPIELRKSN